MPNEPVMTVEEVESFFQREFPQIEGVYAVEAVGPLSSRVRCFYDERYLRPGGTISGLSGSGLVLQDNGGNNLTVSAGATSFTRTFSTS